MFYHRDKFNWLEYFPVKRRKRYDKDAVILTGEDVQQCARVLLEGRARMVLCASDGRQRTVAYLSEGSIFGEVAALSKHPLTADVLVLAESECVVGDIFITDIIDALSGQLSLLPHFLQSVSEKTSSFLEEVAQMAFGTVRAQVATILLALATDKQCVEISQEKLAQIAGRTRVTIALHLHELELAGAIRLERSKICIVNPDILAQLAKDE